MWSPIQSHQRRRQLLLRLKVQQQRAYPLKLLHLAQMYPGMVRAFQDQLVNRIWWWRSLGQWEGGKLRR